MKKTASEYIQEYSMYHQSRQNRLIHMVGIPLIMISVLGMLDYATLFKIWGFPLTLGTVLLTGANLFYLSIHKRLGLVMLPISLAMYVLAVQFVFMVNLGIFVAGWIIQLYGHKVYEKKAPAFVDNFIHLLIGPLFILNEFVKFEPIRTEATSSESK